MLQVQKNTTYNFTKEFMPGLGITKNSWNTRKQDIKEWLKEFYDYTLSDTRPMFITIHAVYGDYEPLPRKSRNITEETKQKTTDYDNYVKQHLTPEFQIISKAKMARDAIKDFGLDKYAHSSHRAVAYRYTGPAMEKYGEKGDSYYWVWYEDYTQPTEEILHEWFDLLKAHRVTDKDIVAAFNEDVELNVSKNIDSAKERYKAAMYEFKAKYGDIVVRSGEWREHK